jgi:Zn-dependent protease
MSGGWWTVGRFRGAPIRLHWTLPLGALAWSRFTFAPAMWLAFAALILIHELGHALLVVRFRLGLSEVALHGAGGYCRHERSGSRFEESAIAWGGVLAQLTLYIGVKLVELGLGPPTRLATAQAFYVFTSANLWLIAINLIPIEPLDGAKAWPLVGMLLARARSRRQKPIPPPRRRSVQDELRDLEKIDTSNETSSEKTDRLVRELIARTTQSKDR